MQYMMMIYVPPQDANVTSTDDAQMREVWKAYTQELVEAGVLRGGEELHPPSTATTVRIRGGQRQIHDGPYADTKEVLGGFYLFDVPDLDAAIYWAEKCPAAGRGALELRPVVEMA